MSDGGDASDAPRLESEAFRDAPSVGRWESLAQAFAFYGFPPANLALVQRLADAIGIDHYEGIASRSYLKGIRRGPGPALKIASGYTGGLVSDEEIVAAVGSEVHRQISDDGRHWWLRHPVNQIRAGNGQQKVRREYGSCPTCGVALPASGACDFCVA